MLSESSTQSVTGTDARGSIGPANASDRSAAIAARRIHAGSGRRRSPARFADALESRHGSRLSTGWMRRTGPLRCRYQITGTGGNPSSHAGVAKLDHAALARTRWSSNTRCQGSAMSHDVKAMPLRLAEASQSGYVVCHRRAGNSLRDLRPPPRSAIPPVSTSCNSIGPGPGRAARPGRGPAAHAAARNAGAARRDRAAGPTGPRKSLITSADAVPAIRRTHAARFDRAPVLAGCSRCRLRTMPGKCREPRPGATSSTTSDAKAMTATLCPISSSAYDMAVAARTAARHFAPLPTAIDELASSIRNQSPDVSASNCRTIGRCSRAVCRQSMWRTSSPGA